jgi:hypothetical protein
LEHFKRLQRNVEFYQNKCHPGNALRTRTPCAKATDVWAQWVARLSARWKGLDDSSDGWMTLHVCKWRCVLSLTHRLA